MPVGKRIYTQRRLPDKKVVEEFSKIPAANIADTMERSCAMHPRIKLVSSPKKEITTGVALTVKCRAGDNLAIHAAMNYAQEGDVLVIANECDDSRSLIGEIMMTYLRTTSKVAGIIVDGPIRDLGEISTWDFPVYCTGSTPGGPYKEGPGEVNVPVSCGNIFVNPGDIIVMDRDGVIAIPVRDAAVTLEKAKAYMETDSAKLKKTQEGKSNRAWVADLLDKKGFEIIDAVYEP